MSNCGKNSVESEQNFCLDKFGEDRNSAEGILVCVRLVSVRIMCNWVLFIVYAS